MITKNVILIIVSVVVALLLFVGGCKYGQHGILKTVGTKVTHDSVRIVYQPTPFKVVSIDTLYIKGEKVVKWIYDTVEKTRTDTVSIVKRCNEIAYYDTTFQLKRGTARLTDTVTMNRITGRRFETHYTDTTTTIQLKPPKNFVLYFGIDYLGYQKTPFFAAGVDLALKLPNDKLFSVGALIDKDGKIIYQAGMKFPIRLRKL